MEALGNRLFQAQESLPAWQIELKQALRTAEDLCRAGFILATEVPAYRVLLAKYQFLLPAYYASLINKTDPLCPIRRQAIPSLEENVTRQDYLDDPLNDLQHQPVPRLTHRYADRVLLHLTQNCSMYCRFCFRKTLLNDLSRELFSGQLEPALAYLANHREIEEVILTGGDPFMASSAQIEAVLGRMSAIPHLRRIRFHTRVPVTFPQRIDDELLGVLADSGKPVVVVSHFNHPKEISPLAGDACKRLRECGIAMLNQSVLLRGVNDNVETLHSLYQKLGEIQVTPYYLHQVDRARGTEHFEVGMVEGVLLYGALKKRLPPHLLPRYVVDEVQFPRKQDVEAVLASRPR